MHCSSAYFTESISEHSASACHSSWLPVYVTPKMWWQTGKNKAVKFAGDIYSTWFSTYIGVCFTEIKCYGFLCLSWCLVGFPETTGRYSSALNVKPAVWLHVCMIRKDDPSQRPHGSRNSNPGILLPCNVLQFLSGTSMASSGQMGHTIPLVCSGSTTGPSTSWTHPKHLQHGWMFKGPQMSTCNIDEFLVLLYTYLYFACKRF